MEKKEVDYTQRVCVHKYLIQNRLESGRNNMYEMRKNGFKGIYYSLFSTGVSDSPFMNVTVRRRIQCNFKSMLQ